METPWFAKRPVSAVRPGDHAWLAYSGAAERDAVIGPFVREGLQTNEKVVYVTDLPPESLPGLTPAPRPGVRAGDPADADSQADLRAGLAAYTRTGQLRVIARRDACLDRDGGFEPAMMLDTLSREVEAAFGQGFRAVRLTTDHSWVLNGPEAAGLPRMLGCEHRVGDAVSPSTMAMAICQVDRRACPRDQLVALRDTHEVLVEVNPEFDDGILKIVRTFEPNGLRVEGELDAARHAVFAEKLAQVSTARRRVHLDFSRLGFIDLGGLGLLAQHATRLHADEALVLDHLPPDVENVIEMVGWHRLPGLTRGGDGLPETEDVL
ncbi:MEDS domain-containing protein [Actinomadura litoris]|uniref:STAS domain-containing protein n=1 Tax=Actinomadura litoris TaxID=2678616 RepID=A0A7K1KXU3_9ACTN|nr:MEDS domain-containing protein [Actinomadura litoris]MUN37021.1 STAS domain-containing protein [Actinomadura litoris]